MRKYLLIFLATLLLILSFWGGGKIKEDAVNKHWLAVVESTYRQTTLSDVRGCFHYIDAEILRYLHVPTDERLQIAFTKVAVCEDLLDKVWKQEANEEIRWILSEAKLFYGGYKETVKETMVNKMALILLYDDPIIFTPEGLAQATILEEKLKDQIEELNKFTMRLHSLIERSW